MSAYNWECTSKEVDLNVLIAHNYNSRDAVWLRAIALNQTALIWIFDDTLALQQEQRDYNPRKQALFSCRCDCFIFPWDASKGICAYYICVCIRTLTHTTREIQVDKICLSWPCLSDSCFPVKDDFFLLLLAKSGLLTQWWAACVKLRLFASCFQAEQHPLATGVCSWQTWNLARWGGMKDSQGLS